MAYGPLDKWISRVPLKHEEQVQSLYESLCVAQLVERRVVVPEAAGSSPVMHLDFLLYVFHFSSALTLKNYPPKLPPKTYVLFLLTEPTISNIIFLKQDRAHLSTQTTPRNQIEISGFFFVLEGILNNLRI